MKLTMPVTSFGKQLTEINFRDPIALDLIQCGIPTRVEKIAGQAAYGVDTGCIGKLAERLGSLADETTDQLTAPDFAQVISKVMGLIGQPAESLPFPLRAPTGKDVRLCGVADKGQPTSSGNAAQIVDAAVVARYASVLGGIPMEKVQNLSCPDFLALVKAVTDFFSPTKEEAETSSADSGSSQGSSQEPTPSS